LLRFLAYIAVRNAFTLRSWCLPFAGICSVLRSLAASVVSGVENQQSEVVSSTLDGVSLRENVGLTTPPLWATCGQPVDRVVDDCSTV
jgi:hypothetical protein